MRVVSRNRTGVASSNDFTERGAREAAASAKEMAEVAAPDPLFPGLAPKAAVRPVDRFFEATADVVARGARRGRRPA